MTLILCTQACDKKQDKEPINKNNEKKAIPATDINKEHDEKVATKESLSPLNPTHEFIASSDNDIRYFVEKYKDERICRLSIEIKWEKCTSSGIAMISAMKQVEAISLYAWGKPIRQNDLGHFFFKPIVMPDAFVEAICKIKSIKTIDVWYGCLNKMHKQMVEKQLPKCEFREHLNKI